MKKTFKKILAVIIVLTMLISQSSLFSFAIGENLIVSMTATANSQLIKNFSGYWTTKWDDDEEKESPKVAKKNKKQDDDWGNEFINVEEKGKTKKKKGFFDKFKK